MHKKKAMSPKKKSMCSMEMHHEPMKGHKHKEHITAHDKAVDKKNVAKARHAKRGM